jgi:hypothetical protein
VALEPVGTKLHEQSLQLLFGSNEAVGRYTVLALELPVLRSPFVELCACSW